MITFNEVKIKPAAHTPGLVTPAANDNTISISVIITNDLSTKNLFISFFVSTYKNENSKTNFISRAYNNSLAYISFIFLVYNILNKKFIRKNIVIQ